MWQLNILKFRSAYDSHQTDITPCDKTLISCEVRSSRVEVGINHLSDSCNYIYVFKHWLWKAEGEGGWGGWGCIEKLWYIRSIWGHLWSWEMNHRDGRSLHCCAEAKSQGPNVWFEIEVDSGETFLKKHPQDKWCDEHRAVGHFFDTMVQVLTNQNHQCVCVFILRLYNTVCKCVKLATQSFCMHVGRLHTVYTHAFTHCVYLCVCVRATIFSVFVLSASICQKHWRSITAEACLFFALVATLFVDHMYTLKRTFPFSFSLNHPQSFLPHLFPLCFNMKPSCVLFPPWHVDVKPMWSQLELGLQDREPLFPSHLFK